MIPVEQVAVNRYKAEHKKHGKSKFNKHHKHVDEKAKPERNQYTNPFKMLQMNFATAPSDSVFTSMPDFNASTNSFANNFNSPVHNEKREVTQKITPFKFKTKEVAADKTYVKPTNESRNKVNNIKLDILICQISEKIGIEQSDLKAAIYAESNGNPAAVNKYTNATGLIQITRDSANSLGTTVNKIKEMSAEEQLKPGGIVERYLTNAKKIAGFKKDDKLSSGQVYSLIFMPAKARKTVLTSSGKSYRWNKGLDKNNDGKITMQDLDNHINNIKKRNNIT